MTNKERFLASIMKREDGCWIWNKAKDKDGYGLFSWKFKFGRGGTKMRRASRVAYELFIGLIPEGMLVCHHCDNPPCVNPDHLFVGTSSDNLFDASSKGRTIGERAARCRKLTNLQIQEMRHLYAEGIYYQKELAIKFNVTSGYVSKILRFKNWPLGEDGRILKDPTGLPLQGLDRWQKRAAIRLSRKANGISPNRAELKYHIPQWQDFVRDRFGRFSDKQQ